MAMNRDLPGMECRHTPDELAMSPQSGQQTPSLPTIAQSLMMDLLVTKLNASIVQQDRADSGERSGTDAETSTRRGDETPSQSLMMDLLVTKVNAWTVEQDRADSEKSSDMEAETSTRQGDETPSSKEGEALRRQDATLTLGSLHSHFGPSEGSSLPLTRQFEPLQLGLGEVPLVRQFAPLNWSVGASSAAQHLTRQRAPLTLGCMAARVADSQPRKGQPTSERGDPFLSESTEASVTSAYACLGARKFQVWSMGLRVAATLAMRGASELAPVDHTAWPQKPPPPPFVLLCSRVEDNSSYCRCLYSLVGTRRTAPVRVH
eukprot:CAMPEP_0204112542 /NCGR_PEP_ID=MMETSP0361-20130328/3124_1 /ASSEMBLY_ACC=CAM_ASM_000343 /TAXON_ID=268821 /ORGANISM="Scrippsiella Hangoei, Strain SHTV-5" /LENGTH=318 /DNA_ID=CAMNT_0051062771 /DNA_START=25 /DNA_END=979 /DNA_ORIENTATION=-